MHIATGIDNDYLSSNLYYKESKQLKHFLPSKVYPPISQSTPLRPICKRKVLDKMPGELKITLPPVQSRGRANFFDTHAGLYP